MLGGSGQRYSIRDENIYHYFRSLGLTPILDNNAARLTLTTLSLAQSFNA